MIQGQTLATVAQKILSDKEHKRDYVADTRAIKMTDKGSVVFKMKEAEMEFTPTRICREQVTDHVGIPRKYADKMAEEAPGLLASNVNHWFANTPEQRMLRTLQNGTSEARAFLSNRYRPLDNADIAEQVLPRLSDLGLEIKSIAVTDTRLYIQAVSPKMMAKVPKIGDEVQAGVIISNSEVGKGSLNMRHLIYTLRCTNGMVAENIVKQHHVGRKAVGELDLDNAQEFFSDATRKADDTAFWLKVNDMMKHTLSREKFDAIVARLGSTAAVELDNPMKVVEVMTERFSWQEGESQSVLKHLIKGGDLTQYGFLNAVTRAAQDMNADYDRAVEFERMGGEIMLLKANDFATN